MLKTKIFLSVLFIASTLFFGFASIALAATLGLSPSSGNYDYNDTFTVSILVDTQGKESDGTDIFALNYDTSLLEVQDADSSKPGVQIESGSAYNITTYNLVDTGAGKIKFSRIATPGTSYIGSATLARISFKVIANNEIQAKLEFDYEVGNTTDTNVISNGMDVLSNVVSATFSLNPGDDPVPTPTPTPTPPPSIPPSTTGYGNLLVGITQNSFSGLPLDGVMLVLNPGNQTATTNSLGNHEWTNLDPAIYSIGASKGNYQSYTKQNITVTANQTTNVNLYLVKLENSSTDLAGQLVKSAEYPAVYYVAKDNKRYVFPNEKTFKTWYQNFDQVVTITKEKLASFPIGGNITYRPGTRLIKITSDPKVYAVEPGGILRPVPDETTVKALYGDNWNKMIDDVQDAYFTNYQMGPPLSADQHPVGTLIKYPGSSDIYYIDQSYQKRKINSAQVLDVNRFQNQYIFSISSQTTYNTGPDIIGAENSLTTVAGG